MYQLKKAIKSQNNEWRDASVLKKRLQKITYPTGVENRATKSTLDNLTFTEESFKDNNQKKKQSLKCSILLCRHQLHQLDSKSCWLTKFFRNCSCVDQFHLHVHMNEIDLAYRFQVSQSCISIKNISRADFHYVQKQLGSIHPKAVLKNYVESHGRSVCVNCCFW